MDEFSVVVLSLAGWVFAASAAAKLSSRQAYRSFRGGLAELGLIPGRMLPAAAASLAGTEVTAAVSMLTAVGLLAAAAPGAVRLATVALAVTAALTMVLVIGVVMVIRRGTPARCACFGAGASRPLGRVHLARNLGLLAVLCAGLAMVSMAHDRPSPAGTGLAAVVGGVLALLFIRWDDLAEVLTPISTSVVPPARRDS